MSSQQPIRRPATMTNNKMGLLWRRIPLVALYVLFSSFEISNGNQFDMERVDEPIPRDIMKKLSDLNLQDAMSLNLRMAQKEYEMAQQMEQYTLETGIHVAKESSAYAQLLDHLPTAEVKRVDRAGHRMEKLSCQFVYSDCITNGIPDKICAKYIKTLDIPKNSELYRECQAINQQLTNATHGLAYRRLLPADYSDGLYKLRTTANNHRLPSARNISSHFFEAAMEKANEVAENEEFSREGKLDRSRSVFFAQWTQFVEQNLAHTVQHTHENGEPIQCCDNNQVAAPRSTSASCASLHVSDKDRYYHKFFVRCLNYVRSAITVDANCKLGAINQINMASDRLDLSQIYGRSEEETDKLRLKRDGKLRTDSNLGLPLTEENCLPINSSCFQSGDSRVNINPYMIVQHSIFHESHNRIAEALQTAYPQWTDEKLFRVARQINRGIYQKITYEEWLTMVVGHRLAHEIRHHDNTERQTNDDSRGVSNEFATAAIRFYNSMLPGDLFDLTSSSSSNASGNVSQTPLFSLRDTFFQPHAAVNWSRAKRTQIVASVLRQKAMAMDTSYVDDLNVDLYRARNPGRSGGGRVNRIDRENEIFGTDSLALDIMRGRDHGLTGYVHYLNACRRRRRPRLAKSRGQSATISTWQELEPFFHQRDLDLLQKMYRHVESIDLIMGGIAEVPENDSLVGPTLSCIIGEQMDKSRRSDPHFYSMDHRVRQTVQNYSAAKLLCDTMGVLSVQADVFQIPSLHGRNPIVCCDELSNGLDLTPWRNVD